jgi:2-oxo-4-hydroxy-4-carboxy-5-ureidoimidazoline decarboxylase
MANRTSLQAPSPRSTEEDPLTGDIPAQPNQDSMPPATAAAGLAAPASALPAGLRRFNEADFGAAEEALLACCGSRRWALRLAVHRPYPTVSSLLAAASEASYDLSFTDLTEALADESSMPQPLLGMRAPGSQAAHTALQAAHAAYEARFGHVFVVSLDDCPAEEMLDQVLVSLRARLGNDPDEERSTAAEELRRIALHRLEHLVASHASAAT